MLNNSKAKTYLIAAMMFWGLGTVLTKSALENFDALVLLPIQLTFSVIFLGILLPFQFGKDSVIRSRRNQIKVGLLGVLNPGISYALALSGLALIPVSTSLVIWATEPLIILIFAFLFMRGSIQVEVIPIMAIAVIGVLLMIGKPSGTSEILGLILTIAAVSACALYSILLSMMKLKDSAISIVFIQQVTALTFALILMLAKFGSGAFSNTAVSPLHIFEAAVGGIAYYGLAFYFYVLGLRMTTAVQAGAFLTLIPVFGLIFSVILLGERISAQAIFGAIIVIGAVAAFALAGQRRSFKQIDQ